MVLGWAAIVVIYLKNRLGKNRVSPQHELGPGKAVHVLNCRSDDTNGSMNELYQKLDDIENHISTQIKEGIENNRKEMKEAITAIEIQHRETRRKLEELEKKTNLVGFT